jgi:hypothetical protein
MALHSTNAPTPQGHRMTKIARCARRILSLQSLPARGANYPFPRRITTHSETQAIPVSEFWRSNVHNKFPSIKDFEQSVDQPAAELQNPCRFLFAKFSAAKKFNT